MQKQKSLRRVVYELLDDKYENDFWGKVIEWFIITLILLSSLAIILESIPSINERYNLIFKLFELLTIFIFSLEYIARLWVAVEEKKYARPIMGRIKWMLSPMAIIDMLAIMPFYLTFTTLDTRFFRSLRLLRVFRILKLFRYSNALRTIEKVVVSKKDELLLICFGLIIIIFIFSSIMYMVEGDAQPEAFGTILDAMWWGIITLTTVGYGDVSPITPIGKLLGAIMALLGVGFIAMPTAILGSAFMEEMTKRKKKSELKAIKNAVLQAESEYEEQEISAMKDAVREVANETNLKMSNRYGTAEAKYIIEAVTRLENQLQKEEIEAIRRMMEENSKTCNCPKCGAEIKKKKK